MPAARAAGWPIASFRTKRTRRLAPNAIYFPNITHPLGGSRGPSGEGKDVLENHHAEFKNAFALPGLSSDPPGGRVVSLTNH